jgi:hypothetical protein
MDASSNSGAMLQIQIAKKRLRIHSSVVGAVGSQVNGEHAMPATNLLWSWTFCFFSEAMGNQQAGAAGGAGPTSPTATGGSGGAHINPQAAASAAQLPKGVKRMPPELQRKFAAGQTHNRTNTID